MASSWVRRGSSSGRQTPKERPGQASHNNFPGAGTLRGVFSKPDSTGRRVTDEVAWENSIQQVLSACKEFNVPCGYPANDSTMMQRRMKEGFTVFITAWGENGFKAVEVGKRVGGR